MPTVMRLDGLRVVIYPNDHAPAHVHVIGPDVSAIFLLNCPDGPPSIRQVLGLKPCDAAWIIDALVIQLAHLCREWRSIHGNH
ncbi:DUF4160 domain-containing protein [Brevundimonas sp.]|uniref:DUF4160 domain-containing protein n=1 Tax=Brevundimonas sp. TaxID=1871086 RepID=UPI002ABBAE4B|nr:DUF4160 domain-containing protein [Brevundimonas sp.]MDZ4362779.1 DUF4160 domain-containing protein [Brevundimonas sp.]